MTQLCIAMISIGGLLILIFRESWIPLAIGALLMVGGFAGLARFGK